MPEGPQKDPKRPKTAFFGRKRIWWLPRQPFLTCETVSLHRPGCALTCSTYILHCSISSQPPDPIMAPKWPETVPHHPLWLQNDHFGPFGTLLGPQKPPLTRETIPLHCPGCALTCSTLVSYCSTSSETPVQLMAPNGDFGRFWTLYSQFGGP